MNPQGKSKDPAFLFYDGDAARDVSHMNRLERGCYFDLIQAQKKFGMYTVEQARKILGKDFDTCWEAVKLILTQENDHFYIEWLRDSIDKRKAHAEIQRKRIQDYWDKKNKKPVIPRKFHGSTVVVPLEDEDVSATAIAKANINISIYKKREEYIYNTWNAFCDQYPALKKISVITGTRRKHLKERVTEPAFKDFDAILAAIKKQPFLLTGNQDSKDHKDWRVSFDWLVGNDTNYVKVLELKYEKEKVPDYKRYLTKK